MEIKIKALPYNYAALKPYLDEKTMRLHHDGHHQTYLDKLNLALDGNPELASYSVEKLLKDLSVIPEKIRLAVKNNGGGHYHHQIFWQMMAPGGIKPSPKVVTAIAKTFGSLEKFKADFTDMAVKHFGSGWVWLVKDMDRNLKIISTPNQDSPLSEGLEPVLGLDIWEHAYYLQYQNKRPDYIKAWWMVVNWSAVEKSLLNQ